MVGSETDYPGTWAVSLSLIEEAYNDGGSYYDRELPEPIFESGTQTDALGTACRSDSMLLKPGEFRAGQAPVVLLNGRHMPAITQTQGTEGGGQNMLLSRITVNGVDLFDIF